LATIARLISFPIRFVCRTGSPPLCDFDVLCRRFATVADDFEFDLLALIECGESGPFHRRDMNEHVLSTSFRLDEAVAFGWVEPLYISYCHLDISGTLKDVLTQAARFRRIIQGDQTAFRPVYMVTSDQRTDAARSSRTIEDYSCFCTLATPAVLEYGPDSSADRQGLSPHRALTQTWPDPLIQIDAQFTGPQDAS
jgi:hypothetical protein